MVTDELRTRKNEPLFHTLKTGPFKIIRRNKGGACELLGPDGTINTRPPHTLILFHGTPVNEDPNSKAVQVEKILEHRLNADNTSEYLVNWKNHDPSYNQWEEEIDFHDFTLIRKYWEAKGKSKILFFDLVWLIEWFRIFG
ncbi:hypothetical protein ROZALSC1DRAFT_24846 [Rozella allomycis CSF55]|uniref:Chromo domain-containing protein n=1 Tax=Rozella allomycis (strain CSF55) TaxID=988480 RepID=A0A4P9YC12_ROZAC|nr:hypothetical protein ROZALSC1DRAFT_24846 [Rozella allomycis CSF55]